MSLGSHLRWIFHGVQSKVGSHQCSARDVGVSVVFSELPAQCGVAWAGSKQWNFSSTRSIHGHIVYIKLIYICLFKAITAKGRTHSSTKGLGHRALMLLFTVVIHTTPCMTEGGWSTFSALVQLRVLRGCILESSPNKVVLTSIPSGFTIRFWGGFKNEKAWLTCNQLSTAFVVITTKRVQRSTPPCFEVQVVCLISATDVHSVSKPQLACFELKSSAWVVVWGRYYGPPLVTPNPIHMFTTNQSSLPR